jgi:predicted short-subunit dehydrogenase-like oxidoreductase (DUF2520 family)
MPKLTLGFIGAGKVAHTLARLWYTRGYSVRAVYSRTANHALALAEKVDAETVAAPGLVFAHADLILLTVSDDTLESVVASMVNEEKLWRGNTAKAVIHTSGVHDSGVLSPFIALGVMTGSLHPAYPFADIESAIQGLPGATFGMEADADVLRGWLEALVEALDGKVLNIPPSGKAAYHSAFVFASNYVVTLYAIAERLLVGLGADREVADNALNTLLSGTLDNLRRQGIPAALTGPLVRGDTQTIKMHIDALGRVDGELAELYKQLALLSLPMLAAHHLDTIFVEQFLNRE